ncbi:MAG: uracil-DNA glycosylase [Bacillota bacterium]
MQVSWDNLIAHMHACTNCPLYERRTSVVPGEGNLRPRLMFIGEGPGEQEDLQGRPFVGPAGQLLTRMIQAIGLERKDVYIANIVKCRPPFNRAPTEDEAKACLPYLRAQVAFLRPRILVALGATAASHIIDPSIRITRDHGNWFQKGSFWLIPTFHPAALLRDPDKKRAAWEDFKSIRDRLKDLDTEQQHDMKEAKREKEEVRQTQERML